MEKYNLKITSDELKNVPLKNALINVIKTRLRLQKNKPVYKISMVEYEILRKHYTWTDKSLYPGTKLKKEKGKYLGKRCVLR